MLQVEEEKVERTLGEKALMGGVVLFLANKIPNAEVECLPCDVWAVPPFTHIHSNCRFISILLPLESSHKCCLASIGIANKHKLHVIEAPCAAQLAVEVTDAITTLLLQVFWWITEAFKATEVEVGEIGETSHLSGECPDVWVITEIK